MGNSYSNTNEYIEKIETLEKNLNDLQEDYNRQDLDYDKLIKEYQKELDDNEELTRDLKKIYKKMIY